MNQLVNNVFEKLRETVRVEEVDAISQLTNDASSKGILYSGVYFGKVYEAREKSLRLIALAVVDSYKQAEIIPSDVIVAEAKENVEAVVDAEIARILAVTRNSYVKLANSSGLQGQLVTDIEAARRSVLKEASRQIDIWAAIYQKRELGEFADLTYSGKKNMCGDLILSKAFNNGKVQPITVHTVDQIPGEWIRIGNEDLFKKNDQICHLQYRDALDGLIAKGYVKWESGILYRLTAEGIVVAENILSRQNAGVQTESSLACGNKAKDKFRGILSWKNPWVQYVYAPILVGIALIYIADKNNKVSSSSVENRNYQVGDNVVGNKIVAENIIINRQDRAVNSVESDRASVSKAKVKINRLFDDYLIAIKALKSKYAEDSGKISSDAASRGVYDSGGHIGSHMKLAISIKQGLDSAKRDLERKIEDVLMENLSKTSLKDAGAGFDSEQARLIEAQKTYDDLCRFLNKSARDKEFAIFGEVKITKDFDIAKY
ncbi:MAG: hypothetical protein A2234_00815 [Elusimicrobia bacterium RIFOXYA2_FULL_58_8]|nr:MAG: hypothetical protein A2285_06065 [Elusimicrobia bacterium RIFOXYA12_FULL_57_11]OGS12220.1 MAG: hypothetical protein A2234_00815 [Elusimicrobia bacterium RIFOXYA2_FULL_58_8]